MWSMIMWFQTLKSDHVVNGGESSHKASLHVSEQWNIASQNVAEKFCIQHLLETSPEEQEFQVSAPGSKTLSVIFPDLDDFDSWIEAVQASIDYTKHAAKAAGMATTVPKKKRKSCASRSHRMQWGNSTLDKDSPPLESGNDPRSNAEAAQLNWQPEAETKVPLGVSSNAFHEEYCSKNEPRGTTQESRDAKDTRKLSKAMMCLETALNEMKLAISSIRTVRYLGPALWHKANVSPPRFYRKHEEHLQSRADREGRHWQPSVGHSYVDALISPRTRETMGSSQSLRRSWDSTSSVDTGAGFPRMVWQSQTMEDLKSSPLMSREDEILKWRNGSHLLTPQVGAKSAMSKPRNGQQQKSARFNPELHGITSSDDEENFASQSIGISSMRVPTGNLEVNSSLHGLVPEFATPFVKNTSLPREYAVSGNAFQPHSDTLGQQANLPQQQFVSFGSTADATPDLARTKMSLVKPLDFRPSRAYKVSFYPQDDVISIPEGEPFVSVPNISNGESRTLNSSSMRFASSTNSGRTSEREVRTFSSAQVCPDPASRLETGLPGRTSSSITERAPLPYYESEKTPSQQLPIHYQSMPSKYFPQNEFSSERESLITEDSQQMIRQSQATLSSNGSFQLRDPFGVNQNSTMVVPKQEELLGQYPDSLRMSTQEVGAGEPPSWGSRISSAQIPCVPTSTRLLSESTYSQDTMQSAETCKQAAECPPPSKQPSQTFLYQDSTQESNSLYGHSSRRNASASSVSIANVQPGNLTTNQFSIQSFGALASEASGYVPGTTLSRNSTVLGDPTAVKKSDIAQTFTSGPELLSKRKTHDPLTQQQSYLQATADGVQRFSQQLAYPAGQLSSELPKESASIQIPTGHYPSEREALKYRDHGPTHTTNGGVVRDQAGNEGYARPQTGVSIYSKPKESGGGVNLEVSMASTNNVDASRHSEEATATAQLSDVAELVNRLVRITAGDEPVVGKVNLAGVQTLDTESLSADSLPPSSRTAQDSMSRTWERPVNMSRVSGDSTPVYHAPAQRYSFEPSIGRSSVQMTQAPHVTLSSSDQDINPALQMQAFNLLGGNVTSISGPITLKSADGAVIILGKERRPSTSGLAVSQGVEQLQTNIGVAAQEERLQDPQQPSRRPSLAGDMRSPSNAEGDAWSLAILKPGIPAQIFKFETASFIPPIKTTHLHACTDVLMVKPCLQ
ncbi:hypothetical protein L7F22_022207 [Adiantum nelumboides]|nr:hypothetical protein [Adiantum nelumboides]